MAEPACLSPQGRQRPHEHPCGQPGLDRPRAGPEEPRPSLDPPSKSRPAEEGLCFRCPFGHPAPCHLPSIPALHCHLPRGASFASPACSTCAAPLGGLSQGTDLHSAVHSPREEPAPGHGQCSHTALVTQQGLCTDHVVHAPDLEGHMGCDGPPRHDSLP